MSQIEVLPLSSQDRAWVRQFITEHWGADFVVARGLIHYPHELPGFVAIQEEGGIGLITYHMTDAGCEIVTLNSLRPATGVGTALLEAVKGVTLYAHCQRVWLVTTNDNLNALRFYQKRGFELLAVHRNALERSRQLKPVIPLVGYDGIPRRDEIELEMILERSV
jgi:ribosomal protein S18 acetylase RimI-like enzyme